VIEEATIYSLWGHSIATLEDNILTINDCGYQTWLTKDRLCGLLRTIEMHIYGDRGNWYLSTKQGSICWEGKHTIDLNSKPYKISPCILRKYRPEVSKALRDLHKRINVLLAKPVILRHVDGSETTLLFKDYNRSGFMRPFLRVTVKNEIELEAFEGKIHVCVAYKAVNTGKLAPLFKKEENDALQKVEPEYLMSAIGEYTDVNRLPTRSKILQTLALIKLVYQED